MTQEIENMLQSAASAVTNRRVHDLLGLFSFPCPVFADDSVKVIIERDYVLAAMNRYFEELNRNSVRTIRLGKHSIAMYDFAKYVVDAEWLYLRFDGSLAFVTINRIYVVLDGKSVPKVEMVETVHSTSPAFHSAMGTICPKPQA
jgi:hypothetical protein